jgi:hypothetical protein
MRVLVLLNGVVWPSEREVLAYGAV